MLTLQLSTTPPTAPVAVRLMLPETAELEEDEDELDFNWPEAAFEFVTTPLVVFLIQ